MRGKKIDGQWRVELQDLPLTEAQRVEQQRRAGEVRAAVEAALPSRANVGRDRRRRSVLDVDSFREALDLLHELEATPIVPTVGAELRDALAELAIGVHAFDPPSKVTALRTARGSLCRSLAQMACLVPPTVEDATRLGWIHRLEHTILPALGGLIRWAERLERGR